ncbi:MAG: hypothetical protein AB7O24_25490 [Kofleriaceae bacterium]
MTVLRLSVFVTACATTAPPPAPLNAVTPAARPDVVIARACLQLGPWADLECSAGECRRPSFGDCDGLGYEAPRGIAVGALVHCIVRNRGGAGSAEVIGRYGVERSRRITIGSAEERDVTFAIEQTTLAPKLTDLGGWGCAGGVGCWSDDTADRAIKDACRVR